MLTPEWHDYHLNALKAHKELQESVIRDIARRIAKTRLLTETADWQLSVAEEAGICREEIAKLAATQSDKSQKELEALFEEAEKENFNFPEKGFEIYGSDLGRISPMMQRIWTAASAKTCTDAINLTKTIAITSQSAFISACDLAHLQIASGAFSYDTAIANAVRSAVGQGATVLYPSGHKDNVDVAVRRAALTSVNQTAGQCMLMKAEELNHDLMEITAHAGARPSHAAWQGQVVSRKGTAGYLSLMDIGYGEASGFMGVNCRHNWSMYFDGSPRAYTPKMLMEYNNAAVSYNGENMPLYEALQRQRAFERKVRKTRNELVGLDEAVKVNPKLKSEFAATSMKLKKQEAELKDFCRQTGIRYDSPRVQVYGFGRSTSQKAVWANKSWLTNEKSHGIIKIKSEDTMLKVNTGGKRNEKALTPEQVEVVIKYAEKLGMPADRIYYVDYDCTAYGTAFDLLRIGTDVFPAEQRQKNPNSNVSMKGAIAHEIIGHRNAALAGLSQKDDVLEEVQASIRAAFLAPDLNYEERITLMRDGLHRLHLSGMKLREVKKLLNLR